MNRRLKRLFRRPRNTATVLIATAVALVGTSSYLASAESHSSSQTVAAAPMLVPELLRVTSARQVEMEVTAYCPCTKCCGPKAQGITASGKTVDYNFGKFIAADTTLLPFGTKVSIPGYYNGEPVEVIDRGGAIKGNKLDVFFASHDEALEWGRQRVNVFVHD